MCLPHAVQDGIKGTLPLYRGTLDAARSIVRQEGYQALYAGLAPAVLGAGVAWGVYFFTYNRAKERYRAWQGSSGKLPAHLHLASAAEAGTLVCFVTNPLWVAKTRLQLQQRQVLAASSAATAAAAAAPYRGLVDCLVKIGRQEGIRGLYKGLVPSLFLVSHGAIQFAVIRSRLQQRVDPSRSVRYVGVAHALRLTLRREGLAGLYRGLAPNVLRVMPQSAITFVVYESIMKWLQPPPRQGSSRPS
ncbi:Mitochondrial folate transporter/carrier [Auxenochlorella protothecoides]|uniref:Mitochondrial folate transporter/carrier n=1 Tax=Auxenochlorella protothecoides TaxID=3075 RepID=A0A087SG32_AUXPR|nr:Mitochondrial folate transporter/carrier [Auxenochlorella protothecoides]KFM24686.1 Mitochondrial folate transporter/carrier [Auxenochlorella protothecoides]